MILISWQIWSPPPPPAQVENNRFQLVTFWLLNTTVLFLLQKWDKKLSFGITSFGREGNKSKMLGRKVGFLIFHSSSGKILSLNINNNFCITLGRNKISVQSPIIEMQLRFFMTTLENSDSLGTTYTLGKHKCIHENHTVTEISLEAGVWVILKICLDAKRAVGNHSLLTKFIVVPEGHKPWNLARTRRNFKEHVYSSWKRELQIFVNKLQAVFSSAMEFHNKINEIEIMGWPTIPPSLPGTEVFPKKWAFSAKTGSLGKNQDDRNYPFLIPCFWAPLS